jgi:DNA-binding NarL/FixJ family response regulator
VLDVDGLTAPAVRQIRAVAPATGIVALTYHLARVRRMKALGSDASCLSKDASAAEMLVAVRVAAARVALERVQSPASVKRRGAGQVEVSRVPGFTPRENEIHACLVAGLSQAEIAEVLRISIETVRSHTAHMRAKAHVSTSRQLITAAQSPRRGRSV